MTGPPDLDPAAPARILIVDDEPLNVDYLEQELEGLGFVTATAADGAEALERVAAAPPDLVLLDVMMPRMDGISALRVLKSDPETRLIPVLLMTALNAVEDRVRGIEAGADDFLSKPVDDRELLARIRTALSVKRAIDQTVEELRSTSAYLERHGTQEREVAVLAIAWMASDESIPDEAVAFVVRRRREEATRRIRALGGMPSEDDATPLVAVFDGPDGRARTTAAAEAALTVLEEQRESAEDDEDDTPRVHASAAVGVGPAELGSARVREAGASRWLFRALGEAVAHASALAHGTDRSGVLLTADAAALVSDRFALEPAGPGAYRVLDEQAGEGVLGAASERRISTILVTDIVGSTRTAERIGDRAWGQLAAAHERATRGELVLFAGEEINTTGDGFVAAFDGASRAARCALAVVDRVAELGLAIRAGIHTGEVERAEGRVVGIALNLATRIAARANPGEVLVSSTTRELAAGSGLHFKDRGEHALKGVVEPRRLYAALELVSGAPTPPKSDVAEYPAGLTAREVDVLRLVAAGLTDAEAAERLFVSVRTVDAHLRSIYRKAGVRSRAAAGRFAEDNGLL
jgi:DNA-binding NarL/FixJ family response regulator